MVYFAVKIDLKKPVFFGRSAEFTCHDKMRKKARIESSRSWNGGPHNTLLCKDGISANKTKYQEKMGKDNSFILEIFDFTELDTDCSYSCTFGVDSTSKKFSLNEKDYECKLTVI